MRTPVYGSIGAVAGDIPTVSGAKTRRIFRSRLAIHKRNISRDTCCVIRILLKWNRVHNTIISFYMILFNGGTIIIRCVPVTHAAAYFIVGHMKLVAVFLGRSIGVVGHSKGGAPMAVITVKCCSAPYRSRIVVKGFRANSLPIGVAVDVLAGAETIPRLRCSVVSSSVSDVAAPLAENYIDPPVYM